MESASMLFLLNRSLTFKMDMNVSNRNTSFTKKLEI